MTTTLESFQDNSNGRVTTFFELLNANITFYAAEKDQKTKKFKRHERIEGFIIFTAIMQHTNFEIGYSLFIFKSNLWHYEKRKED